MDSSRELQWQCFQLLLHFFSHLGHRPVFALELDGHRGFLRYLLLQFWILLLVIDGLILVGWLVITIASPIVGVLLVVPALIVGVLPDIVAYLAVHGCPRA